MDDFVNLHYTKAAIAEVARIRTVAPFGIPQWVSEIVYVKGFTIAKDTMTMPLLWAIHMDPKVYENLALNDFWTMRENSSNRNHSFPFKPVLR